MKSAKKGVQLIAETCRRKGIRKVVFSPGSRSGPFVIAFSQMPEIECLVIPDERVAGYFALGMAQQLHEPVAVVCTSGTAVINLMPAACEASYQEVPMLFITADRPKGAADKGENQAIHQEYIFSNFAADIELDADNDTPINIIKHTEEAIFNAHDLKQPSRINVHIAEPLYQTTEEESMAVPGDMFQPEAMENTTALRNEAQKKLLAELNQADKKLVVIGLRNYNKEFSDKIAALASRSDYAILIETTSNTVVTGAIGNYDACIEVINGQHTATFVPDIVITLGNQIISKRIRQFLRKNKPKKHWNIPLHGEHKKIDYFELNNDELVYLREDETLDAMLEAVEKKDSAYNSNWQKLAEKTSVLSREYLTRVPFSDLKVFETLVRSFPAGANIQYGNSTPVRYSNFFAHNPSLTVNSNRGTSGIDGCVSTAAGAAYVNGKLTILVVGDISFFYDSNALWNNHLSPDFRIVVINNSGGNIFRLIDGPTNVKGFEKYFETRHNLTAAHLATMYGIPYYICARQSELEEALKTFYQPQNGKSAILEIKTDSEVSAKAYKDYFRNLRM